MKNFLATILVIFIYSSLTLAQLQIKKPTKIVIKPTSAVVKQLPKRNLFPTDTVARFIKKYSKDSLVNLINNRITISETYIAKNIENINVNKGDLPIVELMLLSKHFKLDSNFITFDTSKYKEYFYNLYDVYSGNTAQISKVLDSFRNEGLNLADSLKNTDITNEFGQRMVVSYCDKFSLTNDFFEKLYESVNTKNLEYKIHMYWNFVALGRKCKSDSIILKSYQTKLFDELYPSNNLKRDFVDLKINSNKNIPLKDSTLTMASDAIPAYLEFLSFTENHNAIRMLAYALYANDINLKKHSDNLMYLLDAQQKDGSWNASIKYGAKYNETTHTIYGLWSLLEWKSKLLENM